MVMNILIVDDELIITSMLSQYLSAKGHNVTAVNSPETILPLADWDRFDVVITDLIMSPVGGIAFVSHLRSNGYTGKVILMTGFCREDEIDIKALSIDAFLEKPFDLNSVTGKLKELGNQDGCFESSALLEGVIG
ncbi:MAG: response regulator [Nitrospirae bacterium]|nr:MAG: response regulator [Nitrospirota bacterium]